jgi:hypothetical protein
MGLLIQKQDVIDLLGQDAVDNFTDDGVQDVYLDQAIEDAEAWLIGQLVFRYTVETLAQSPQVRLVVKYYAAYLLTTRRGGVFYYGEDLDRYESYVQALRERRAELADANGVQLTQDASAHLPVSMTNLVVDERFPQNRIRAIDASSERTVKENSFSNDGVSFFGY